MNYTEKSNFEINVLVAKSLGLIIADHQPSKNKVTVRYSDYNAWFSFDPCNNPSDAWPIIVENGISIFYKHKKWTATDMDGPAQYYNQNPLRAAMIAYLMIKESENE